MHSRHGGREMKISKIASTIVLLFITGFTGCTTHSEIEAASGFYKDSAAKAAAFESYDQVMELWDREYDEDWIPTEYGITHVILSGSERDKPLFLFPGLFTDASMWYANAGALSEQYRVIAVDLPVYGGKSEPSEKPIEDIQDYALWFQELLAYYGYERAAVAGLSYGSWLSLALAREMPQAIAAVIMLDPSETFMRMSSVMAWQGFRYFLLFPSRDKYRKFFTWIAGGFSDERSTLWMEHMIDVIEYGRVGMMDVPQHRVYTPEELTMVDMPTLILAGDKPIIYKDPEVFAEAAGKALPHAQISLIEYAGHSLQVEKPETVNARILSFLAENYKEMKDE